MAQKLANRCACRSSVFDCTHHQQGATGEEGSNVAARGHKLKDGQVSFSVGCMIAWALWTLAVLTLSVAVTYGIHELATIAVVSSVAGATATMRTYFVRHNRMVKAYAAMLIKEEPVQTVGILTPLR